MHLLPHKSLNTVLPLLLLYLGLSGCGGPNDFGQPASNWVDDVVVPTIGAGIAYNREEAVSDLTLTRDEEDLRRQGEIFVNPPSLSKWTSRFGASLRKNRFIGGDTVNYDIDEYGVELLELETKDITVLYNRLYSDIERDLKNVCPVRKVMTSVNKAEALRQIALANASNIEEEGRKQIEARIVENQQWFKWIDEGMQAHYHSYRVALDRLTATYPLERSVSVQELLKKFYEAIQPGGCGEDIEYPPIDRSAPTSPHVVRFDPRNFTPR